MKQNHHFSFFLFALALHLFIVFSDNHRLGVALEFLGLSYPKLSLPRVVRSLVVLKEAHNILRSFPALILLFSRHLDLQQNSLLDVVVVSQSGS